MQTRLIDEMRQMLIANLFVADDYHQIGPDTPLDEKLNLDSADLVELRVLCEDRFDVLIGEEDFTRQNFRTLRSLARLIEELRREPRLTAAEPVLGGMLYEAVAST